MYTKDFVKNVLGYMNSVSEGGKSDTWGEKGGFFSLRIVKDSKDICRVFFVLFYFVLFCRKAKSSQSNT